MKPGDTILASCEDGKLHHVCVTSEPDTFFSVPASMTYRCARVSGFLTKRDEPDRRGADYDFTAEGKNGHLLRAAGGFARCPNTLPHASKAQRGDLITYKASEMGERTGRVIGLATHYPNGERTPPDTLSVLVASEDFSFGYLRVVEAEAVSRVRSLDDARFVQFFFDLDLPDEDTLKHLERQGSLSDRYIDMALAARIPMKGRG